MQIPDLTDTQRDIYSVSRLNREVRALLESSFPLLWVEGEISNLARPSSGHWYFSLKDSAAQVRCAMFRNRNTLLKFRPKDGMQVLARARISLYEARGDYQLIVEHLEEAGHGALQRAFEELKRRLAQEGLFDEAHKRLLPAFARRVGIITSPTGAAIRDVLSVLRRRFPALPVLVYPVPVQGEGAAQQIAETIREASRRRDCDVLILTRGGGSLEDLWAFNEEVVARAVYDCEIPIVCGVGHEIDFSIADFVADVRAPTPSAAAELISPDQQELAASLRAYEGALTDSLAQRLREQGLRLEWLHKRLQQRHPAQRLAQQSQRVDELEQRMQLAWSHRLRRHGDRLMQLQLHLRRVSPALRLERQQVRNQQLAERLFGVWRAGLEHRHHQLAGLSRALHTVSPLATLGRGYSILRRKPDDVVVRNATQVQPGDKLEAILAEGRLLCEVEKVSS